MGRSLSAPRIRSGLSKTVPAIPASSMAIHPAVVKIPFIEASQSTMGKVMLHILKRHPVPIVARFEKAVTLTYAFPREILIPLLSPGLELDAYGANGFLAVATVHTTDLRPAFLPKAFGRHFFLTNYRLFTRFKPHGGKELRGLQTLRSDTDLSWLVVWGNRTTRYGYRKAEVEFANQAG